MTVISRISSSTGSTARLSASAASASVAFSLESITFADFACRRPRALIATVTIAGRREVRRPEGALWLRYRSDVAVLCVAARSAADPVRVPIALAEVETTLAAIAATPASGTGTLWVPAALLVAPRTEAGRPEVRHSIGKIAFPVGGREMPGLGLRRSADHELGEVELCWTGAAGFIDLVQAACGAPIAGMRLPELIEKRT